MSPVVTGSATYLQEVPPSGESHDYTISESRYEARFPLQTEVPFRPMSEQDNGSEYSDEARVRYDRKRHVTNKRSRSGNRTYPTALDNEAQTLCIRTLSTKRFRSQHLPTDHIVNIFTKTAHRPLQVLLDSRFPPYLLPSPFHTPVLAHWWLRYYRRLTL
ncbi:hypothetical protein FHG87_011991 [Trinorchestia longiramus]|nr:hypothetical protein FHG87_011991 [Trinorchestia longiramus]